MRKVLIIDTSILCIWLEVPGMDDCGPDDDKWNKQRVSRKIQEEERHNTTFVLPLASIIETGNHISHADHSRRERGEVLADQRISLGDATIKDVAEFYAQMSCQVEILTGDAGLKAHEPAVPTEVPRWKQRR